MTARDTNSAVIKKLTKRKKETGELYARRPDAELQIGKVLLLEKPQIFELLTNKQQGSVDYLLDETIVYLLRDAGNNNETIEILYSELNRRIWKLLRKFYKNFNNPTDFEDFGQKIEMAIIRKIFDTATDSSDYAQVNFGDFVVTQAKVVWREQLVKINREKEIFYTSREETEDSLMNEIETTIASKDALADFNIVLREGLEKLPPHIMLVAELLLDGWQIESKDEREPTISKKLDVSSRTIRNWLKEARVILADYRTEVRR